MAKITTNMDKAKDFHKGKSVRRENLFLKHLTLSSLER